MLYAFMPTCNARTAPEYRGYKKSYLPISWLWSEGPVKIEYDNSEISEGPYSTNKKIGKSGLIFFTLAKIYQKKCQKLS